MDKVYDRLGLLSPLTSQSKILVYVQEIWKDQDGWDDVSSILSLKLSPFGVELVSS